MCAAVNLEPQELAFFPYNFRLLYSATLTKLVHVLVKHTQLFRCRSFGI